ncbi:MAG: glycosyltransferase family 4 protein [bacterium]
MKNILVLTSVYPAEEFSKRTTPVVHYFAKEWVKMGYNVKVIHNYAYFPKMFYPFIGAFKNILLKFANNPRLHTKQRAYYKEYNMENVNVHRMPIFKLYPRALFSTKSQRKQIQTIKELLERLNFVPDYIIGHWPNPQLLQVYELGKIYNNALTCMVMHHNVEAIRKITSPNTNQIISKIDSWGFRSKNIQDRFIKYYGKPNNSFICFSGVPQLNKENINRSFKSGIKEIIFIGQLIPRKRPVDIIRAINLLPNKINYRIKFIGAGPERNAIKKIAEKSNLENNISVIGNVPRSEVFEHLKTADCFIMLSKPETFGLVYLEAMSMGCITIGSKGEGIDGIIQNSYNGFLIEPGNIKKLTRLLRKLDSMPAEDLACISDNAIKSVENYTDVKAAKHYIDSIRK